MATRNMNLEEVLAGEDTSAQAIQKQNENANKIDSHDHSPGKGVPVPSSGIRVDDNLSFNNFSINLLKTLGFAESSHSEANNESMYRGIGNDRNKIFYKNSSGVSIEFLNASPQDNIPTNVIAQILTLQTGSNLNSIGGSVSLESNHVYILKSGSTYTNTPAGFDNNVDHIFYVLTDNTQILAPVNATFYQKRSYTAGAWTNWIRSNIITGVDYSAPLADPTQPLKVPCLEGDDDKTLDKETVSRWLDLANLPIKYIALENRPTVLTNLKDRQVLAVQNDNKFYIVKRNTNFGHLIKFTITRGGSRDNFLYGFDLVDTPRFGSVTYQEGGALTHDTSPVGSFYVDSDVDAGGEYEMGIEIKDSAVTGTARDLSTLYIVLTGAVDDTYPLVRGSDITKDGVLYRTYSLRVTLARRREIVDQVGSTVTLGVYSQFTNENQNSPFDIIKEVELVDFNVVDLFTSLKDSPSSYVGKAGNFLTVKRSEDGIEFKADETLNEAEIRNAIDNKVPKQFRADADVTGQLFQPTEHWAGTQTQIDAYQRKAGGIYYVV